MRDTIDVTQRATLVRLPEDDLLALRSLASATRVSQSSYMREAIADLLRKYDDVISGTAAAQSDRK